MQDSANNQETVYNEKNETVICPNRLCGKEISVKFDKCPFCHTLLIKPKKTAEDIINEHKHTEREEDLKDAIRKQYNIDGDISEEQYGQLREIYLKEHGPKYDANTNESSSGQRNGRIGWIVGISAVLIIFLIIVFAAGGSHSKTYNDYMHSIHEREAAIDRATSLFDMANIYDWKHWRLGTGAYLEGDEKRDIDLAIDGLDDLYEMKCQQLFLGKYKFTSNNGDIYMVELTNLKDEVLKEGLAVVIYRNNKLYSKGSWFYSGATAIGIHHRLITDNREWNYESVTVYLDMDKQLLVWSGNMEEHGGYGSDKGTAQKIGNK